MLIPSSAMRMNFDKHRAASITRSMILTACIDAIAFNSKALKLFRKCAPILNIDVMFSRRPITELRFFNFVDEQSMNWETWEDHAMHLWLGRVTRRALVLSSHPRQIRTYAGAPSATHLSMETMSSLARNVDPSVAAWDIA